MPYAYAASVNLCPLGGAAYVEQLLHDMASLPILKVNSMIRGTMLRNNITNYHY
jgi:hypothetical protein